MRKIKLYCILFAVVAFSGCEDDLQPKTDNSYGDEDQWRLPERAEGALMNAYANIATQVDGYGNNFLDAATDNAVTNDFGSEVYALGRGSISTTSNPFNVWSTAYTQFRNIHLFLENGLGDNVVYSLNDPEADALQKARLKGEAYFLRAWWGFKLLQHYGGKTVDGKALGYPIITHTIGGTTPVDPELFQRNTYAECLAQISLDCDSAAYYLPDAYTGSDPILGVKQLGRATRLAALALKSRAYTYGASPAYQTDDVTVINGMGDFAVVDAGTYIEQWERAAEVSYEAITAIGNFTSLTTDDFNAGSTPSEFLLRFYHNNRSLENRNYPPMFYGNGITSPSQNLVNAFPMKNGFPIDEAGNYDAADPYKNRDPRLALTVLYNGSTLGGNPVEIVAGSKDARGSHPKATRTGYYLNKWLSAKENMLDPENPQNDHHYNALLRKSEVYLNFAEASNEAWGPDNIGPGFTQSALDVIKSIRSAAGITGADPYVTQVAAEGKEAFRALIQNERRLTLAFENHRFFDLRRWLMPLNTPVTGVQIASDEGGTLSFEEFTVEERNLNDIRYYYLPLPYDEVIKSNLKNNLGWN